VNKLAKEDQELLTMVEKGEWTSVKNLPGEKNTIRRLHGIPCAQDKRINIRSETHAR